MHFHVLVNIMILIIHSCQLRTLCQMTMLWGIKVLKNVRIQLKLGVRWKVLALLIIIIENGNIIVMLYETLTTCINIHRDLLNPSIFSTYPSEDNSQK